MRHVLLFLGVLVVGVTVGLGGLYLIRPVQLAAPDPLGPPVYCSSERTARCWQGGQPVTNPLAESGPCIPGTNDWWASVADQLHISPHYDLAPSSEGLGVIYACFYNV